MASDGIEAKSIGLGLGPDVDLSDEAAARVIEISGVIKWFDVAKGYGFIVPDSGVADVLLHVTCLRRDGYQTAYEGARVVCEVLARPKGLQAFRVISMDDSTAIHPAQMPPPRTHVTVAPTSGLERAQVKWFNRLRGFGFLTRGRGRRHLRPHGDAAPVRHCRIAARPVRPGPLWARSQGTDGGRGSSRGRIARTLVALAAIPTTSRVRMPRLVGALFAALMVCVALGAAAPAQAAGQSTLEIVSKTGAHSFAVELATNDDERSRGLMFRKELPEGRGMLFDFEREAPVAFWMHNTYIPLDMIFIRGDGSVLRIAENAEPLSDRLVPSGGPVRAVLEVIGGTARKLGIAPGDHVTGSIFDGSH